MDDFKDLSVLYVEDNPQDRHSFSEAMAHRFGEFRTAENAEQALELFRERPCDLLVTDLLMSGMGGLELCRTVRRLSQDVPIVITSAVLSRTVLLACVNVGVDGYILKPIEPGMVETVLSQAVSRLRLRRQTVKDARLWQQTFDAVPDLVAVLDRELKVVRLNRAAQQVLAMDEQEAVGKVYCQLLRAEQDADCCELLQQVLIEGHEYTGDEPLHIRGGYYHITVSPVRDMDGATIGAVHVARDVTELKRTEDALRYAGTHDPLTGLYNRTWFETECDRLSRGRTAPISVVVADLDGLKQVNDEAGHKAGDELLCRAATLLVSCCRADDGVARIGGDEFAVLLPAVAEKDAWDMMHRIRQKMEAGRLMLGNESVALSLGMATSATADGLAGALTLADKRMYEDKAARRLTYAPQH